jgi:hypothetical protein
MTKNQKMLLGAAVVLGVGYYLYTKNKTAPKSSYAGPYGNLASFEDMGLDEGGDSANPCPCRKVVKSEGNFDKCLKGHWCKKEGKSQE